MRLSDFLLFECRPSALSGRHSCVGGTVNPFCHCRIALDLIKIESTDVEARLKH